MTIDKALYVYCNCETISKFEYNDPRIRSSKSATTLTLTMPPCKKCGSIKVYTSETDNSVLTVFFFSPQQVEKDGILLFPGASDDD